MFIHNNLNQRWRQSSPFADQLCFYSTKKNFPASLTKANFLSPISVKPSFKWATINSGFSTKRFKPNNIRLSACFHRMNSSSDSSSIFSKSNSTNQTSIFATTSNRSSFQSSKSILQQNRILINYKKLAQFENFFLKNLSFLKKNFEIIQSYLKISTKLSDLKFVSELKDQNESISPDEPYQISQSGPEVQLRHKLDSKRRAYSEPLYFCSNSNSCTSFCVNLKTNKNKFLFRFSNSLNRSNILNRKFSNELHLKLLLNTLCKRNSSFFNELESIAIRSENPFDNKRKEIFELSHIELSKDALFYKRISDGSNSQPKIDLFSKQFEFSISMIKFTLCLQTLLRHIDQVKIYNKENLINK